jgi:hypothetical protein
MRRASAEGWEGSRELRELFAELQGSPSDGTHLGLDVCTGQAWSESSCRCEGEETGNAAGWAAMITEEQQRPTEVDTAAFARVAAKGRRRLSRRAAQSPTSAAEGSGRRPKSSS